MLKYRYLLFDLDDTILDFQLSQNKALKRIHSTYTAHIEEQIFFQTYTTINEQLWAKYEKKEMTKDAILKTRFSKTFEQLKIEVNGLDAAKDYQEYLSEGTDLLLLARQTLDLCVEAGYKMYVVSNGVYETQMKRLIGADLVDYFEAIYVSEVTGSQKPFNEFFDFVFEHSPEIEKSKTLMIGDSLSADIAGAKNAGVSSCWYNGLKQHVLNDATFEVTNHFELQALLMHNRVPQLLV